MNLVIYANANNGIAERLRRAIEPMVPLEQVMTFTTIDGLKRKLRQPAHGLAIAVLLAASRQDLVELHAIKDLLDDIRIILILPDGENETTALGHKLSPRFISYINGSFDDVGAVLHKMVAYMKSNYIEYGDENGIE